MEEAGTAIRMYRKQNKATTKKQTPKQSPKQTNEEKVERESFYFPKL